ncbi:MAG: hypothetical protein K2H60_11645 [Muribaculaceae bacterium]|nr:hypothetical protein [Muribaculaceae bacterium]
MANKRHNKGSAERVVKCAFQEAVEKTAEVRNGFCVGKQAIKNSDRGKIEAADDRKLQGSLDIDSQVKMLYPHDPRWDYALSYDNMMYYVEIHPAETSEVDKVVSKVRWLKNWLRAKAPEIDKLPKAAYPYIWVQSGRYAILPNSKEMRKLSVAGLITTKTLNLK